MPVLPSFQEAVHSLADVTALLDSKCCTIEAYHVSQTRGMVAAISCKVRHFVTGGQFFGPDNVCFK